MTRRPSINLFRTINGLPLRRAYQQPPAPPESNIVTYNSENVTYSGEDTTYEVN